MKMIDLEFCEIKIKLDFNEKVYSGFNVMSDSYPLAFLVTSGPALTIVDTK